MAEDIKPALKRVEEFEPELESIERDINERVMSLDGMRPGHRLAVHQAEWHVRGIVYHGRHLIEHYRQVAQDAAERVVGTGADVIVMHAPAIQKMWFEYYSLVNLARITLDHLRDLLAPIFATSFGNLPKSITGYLKGGTDCPVYAWLASQPGVEYLSDMRNCLVHFRSFATGDNAVIVKEGFDDEQLHLGDVGDWMRPMAKGMFRRIGQQGVSVNFYVPDTIFDRSGSGEKLARFTYEQRYNVLSQSISIIRLVAGAVLMSLVLLEKVDSPSFHFEKPKK